MRLLTMIEDWISEVEGVSPLFVKWTALAMVSACLQRKVCYDLKASGKALPTIYVLLVGLPGCGKSFTLGLMVRNLLNGLQHAPVVSPSQITPAALVEDIIKRVHGSAEAAAAAHSTPYFVLSSEFQVFFRDFGGGNIMPYLLDWYDYRDPYELWSKGTRSSGVEAFANPAITVLGATAPSYLKSEVVSQAGADGLASRFMFVNDRNVYPRQFEAEHEFDHALTAQIRYEFQRLLDFSHGTFHSTPDAIVYGQTLVDENTKKLKEAAPNSALREFYARRIAHIQSLALLYSATETDFDPTEEKYLVKPKHLKFAKDMYDDLEGGMSALFGHTEVRLKDGQGTVVLAETLRNLKEPLPMQELLPYLAKFDILITDPDSFESWARTNGAMCGFFATGSGATLKIGGPK